MSLAMSFSPENPCGRPASGCGNRREIHLEAELLQAPDMMAFDVRRVELIEVVRAEVLEGPLLT